MIVLSGALINVQSLESSQSYRSPGCRLESGGTENRLAAIAAQILRHFLALRYDQFNSFRFTGKCDAPRFILNGAVWNSALAGRAVGRP